jgi:hypothetical protein
MRKGRGSSRTASLALSRRRARGGLTAHIAPPHLAIVNSPVALCLADDRTTSHRRGTLARNTVPKQATRAVVTAAYATTAEHSLRATSPVWSRLRRWRWRRWRAANARLDTVVSIATRTEHFGMPARTTGIRVELTMRSLCNRWKHVRTGVGRKDRHNPIVAACLVQHFLSGKPREVHFTRLL